MGFFHTIGKLYGKYKLKQLESDSEMQRLNKRGKELADELQKYVIDQKKKDPEFKAAMDMVDEYLDDLDSE